MDKVHDYEQGRIEIEGKQMSYRHQLIDDETGKVVFEITVKDDIGDLTEIGEFVLSCEMFVGRLFGDGINKFRSCVIDGAEEEKKP